MKSIPNYPHCFVCGDKNAKGLHITFYYEEAKAKAEYTPAKEYEGYEGILHGGIVSTLLDEVMIQSIVAVGIPTFTVHLEVRFKEQARIGEKLHLEGYPTREKGRIILTEGTVTKTDGTLIASAKGKYFKVQGEMKEQLKRP